MKPKPQTTDSTRNERYTITGDEKFVTQSAIFKFVRGMRTERYQRLNGNWNVKGLDGNWYEVINNG